MQSDSQKLKGLQDTIGKLEASNKSLQGDTLKLNSLQGTIDKLQTENKAIGGLQSTITELKNRKPEIIEKTVDVEKRVDNPEHLKKITALEASNKALQSDSQKLKGLQDTIDKLEASNKSLQGDAQKLNSLQGTIDKLQTENKAIAGLQSTINELKNRKPEIVEKTIEVEKLIDNPKHLARISDLEAELKTWSKARKIDINAGKKVGIPISAQDDFTAIEGVGPKISGLLQKAGIHSFEELSNTDPQDIQKILDKAGAAFKTANPGTWSDQANLVANNRWPALRALQDILIGGVYPDGSTSGSESKNQSARIKTLEIELAKYKQAASKEPKPVDYKAAKAAGYSIRSKGNKHDFTVIEGIGPKIDELIHKAGIHTYSELSETDPTEIQAILNDGGSNFALAKPASWPDQSAMASNNEWAKLKKAQDEFIA